MAEYEVFANAPVEEAIITILLSKLEDIDSRVESVSVALGSKYPVVERSENPSDETGVPDGVRLLSADRQQVIQITSQSFSFHRLRPYTYWGAFSFAAREAWDAFAVSTETFSVLGVRLRYVNEFQLPLPFEDWADYLLIRPELPPPVDTGLSSYMMSLTLDEPGVPAEAVVTQIITWRSEGGNPVVFDIDTISKHPPAVYDHPETVWTVLEDLREYKNRLFFEGLTDRAKELFR
jgi:uncharacterized protein (TIGR04255 family)